MSTTEILIMPTVVVIVHEILVVVDVVVVTDLRRVKKDKNWEKKRIKKTEREGAAD